MNNKRSTRRCAY